MPPLRPLCVTIALTRALSFSVVDREGAKERPRHRSRMALTERKSRVCYFYNSELGSYYYGANHPMKPHRLRMTHALLLSYGLYKKMDVYRPHRADYQELTLFHSHDYNDFIKRVTPDNCKDYLNHLHK